MKAPAVDFHFGGQDFPHVQQFRLEAVEANICLASSQSHNGDIARSINAIDRAMLSLWVSVLTEKTQIHDKLH